MFRFLLRFAPVLYPIARKLWRSRQAKNAGQTPPTGTTRR
jgi:hypothetical protein